MQRYNNFTQFPNNPSKNFPQKPVHFFSASDKETDTNNMHLQRHADEGRGRYETSPLIYPLGREQGTGIAKTKQPARPAGFFPSY
jgi:hypothetical protein